MAIENNKSLIRFNWGSLNNIDSYVKGNTAQIGDVLFAEDTATGSLFIAIVTAVGTNGSYKIVKDSRLDVAVLRDNDHNVEVSKDSVDRRVVGVAAPTNDNDATNKKYVDDKITTVNNTIGAIEDSLPLNYLKLDGTNEMTATLQMGGQKIVNLADGEADTDAVTVSQLKDLDANLRSAIGSLDNVMNFLGTTYTTPTTNTVVLTDDKTITAVAGDIVLVVARPNPSEATPSDVNAGNEYVYTGTVWVKIGDETGLSSLRADVESLTEDVRANTDLLTWKTF